MAIHSFYDTHALQGRGIKLLKPKQRPKRSSDSDDDNRGPSRAMAGLDLDGLCSVEATGAKVFLDEQGVMHWPVLFLYPEHQQTDFISAFSESSRYDYLSSLSLSLNRMWGWKVLHKMTVWFVDLRNHPTQYSTRCLK